MTQNMPVALIGSNVLLRDGLAQILCGAGFDIVLSAASFSEEIDEAATENSSLIVVVEFDGDTPQTVQQIKSFRSHHPEARIAVLVDAQRGVEIRMALQSTIDAFVCRTANHQTFIKILELISLGESFVPTAVLQRPIGDTHHDTGESPRLPIARPDVLRDESEFCAPEPCVETAQFSTQESRILQQMIGGASNKVIARNMNIAEATVKVHVKTILRKLRVQNRTQAAIWAISHTSLAKPDVRLGAS